MRRYVITDYSLVAPDVTLAEDGGARRDTDERGGTRRAPGHGYGARPTLAGVVCDKISGAMSSRP